jgi:hypothetical protein
MVPAKELPLSDLADEFAETRLRMMAWKPNVNPDFQRFQELSAELLARHAKEPAEKRIQVQGIRYIVPISPQENKRTITKPFALYRLLKKKGEKKLLQWYKITLGAIDKAIPDEKERAKYLKQERTGAREIGEPVLKEIEEAA